MGTVLNIRPATRVSMEAALLGIWRQVLNTPEVAVDDNFFVLGGNSIMLARMVSAAVKAGLVLQLDQAFDNPTVAQLSRLVSRKEDTTTDPRQFREVLIGDPRSPRQVHIFLTSGEDLPIVGALAIRDSLLDAAIRVLMPTWHETQHFTSYHALSEVITEHIAASTHIDRFTIVGHCSASPLAAATACRLSLLGKEIQHVILLDALVPGPDHRATPLDTLMPIDDSDPDRLQDLRAAMTSITRRRVGNRLPAEQVMRLCWNAVDAASESLLLAFAGDDSANWSENSRRQAIRNHMSWLNLVIGMEEPLAHRLPAGTPVTLVTGEAPAGTHWADEWIRQWATALGGTPTVVVDDVRHSELIGGPQLAALLSA